MAPGLGDFLRGMLGGADKPEAPPEPAASVEHKGFVITPAPRRDKGVWYVAGGISQTVDGTVREHHFIRADNTPDRDQAIELTVVKARQIIDLEGERMFARGSDPAAG